MTKPAQAPPWLPPVSLVACVVIGVGLVMTTPDAIVIVGQAFLLIMILRGFCYWPPMAQFVKSMPAAHRLVFGVLVGAMIFGHYSINTRTYFPFVAWRIFPVVREEDPVTCREFIATTQSGAKVRLLVEQLFPSIVQIDAVESYSPETTEHVARAMAKIYNEQHAADPVRHIDLFVMAVKLHPPASESRAQPSCELLKRYDISSGR